MGCCGSHNRSFFELTFDSLDNMDKLEQEINNIIHNKNKIKENDKGKIRILLNQTFNKKNKLEEKLNQIHNCSIEEKQKNNMINLINQEIKVIRNYKNILNDIYEEIELEDELNSQDKQYIEQILKEEIETKNNKKSNNRYQNLKLLCKNEKIYYKKNIKKNSKKNKQNNKLNTISSLEYISEIKENLSNENNIEVMNPIINIIFNLEDEQKICIQIDKRETLLKALEKLGEKVEGYYNIDNIFIFDGDNEIIDDVKEGKKIEDFGFNDYKNIQVKFFSKID